MKSYFLVLMRVFNSGRGKIHIKENSLMFSMDCCYKLFSFLPVWLDGKFFQTSDTLLAFLHFFSWKERSEWVASWLFIS